MARSRNQRRWRANTSRQRIELYLRARSPSRTRSLVTAHGTSRAAVIANLIAKAAPAVHAPTTRAASATDAVEPATKAVPASGSTDAAGPVGSYRFRRPGQADEKRYRWIVDVGDGARIALGPDPARFYRWRGVILDGSVYLKEAKGRSRNAVVVKLLQ